jgi:hypothetical protein
LPSILSLLLSPSYRFKQCLSFHPFFLHLNNFSIISFELFHCLNAYNLDCPLKRFLVIFLASCLHLFGPSVVFPRLFFLVVVTKLCLYRFASLDPWYLCSISSACSASLFVTRPFVLFFYIIFFLSSLSSSLSSFLSSSLNPLARPLPSHPSHRSISPSYRPRLSTYQLLRSHSSLSCLDVDSVVRSVSSLVLSIP